MQYDTIMQALWTRTAQANSCRCSSCLQAATTIARRTTTAASRRRVNAGDLFTACYSTILATAAVADAKVKDDRRKEWDRLITEAKSLPLKKPEGHDRIPTADKSGGDRGDQLWSRKPAPIVWDGTGWAPAKLVNDARWVPQLKVLESHVKQSLADPAKTPMYRSPSDLLAMQEGWIDDEVPEGIRPDRLPKNHIQIVKVEGTVARLVHKLLLQSRANSSVQSSSLPAHVRADLSTQMKEMTMRIDALRYSNIRLPAYSYLDPVSIRQELADLHDSLIVLLKKCTSDHSSIDLIVSKICYNLLISASPPNITTYNILIDHFTRLQRHDLGQIVVDSFLFESRYRPNPATICLLLDHFAAKGDSVGFRNIIRRMRGVDGDIRIKRRALSMLHMPNARDWAMNNKVIHRNGLLSQKVPRTAQIFDSLIQGCLKLADVRSAIRYFRAAIREGCQVKSAVLCRIADACLEKLDYRAGRSLLSAILSQWETGSCPDHEIEYCRTTRYAVYQILGLCQVSIDSTQELPVKASRTALRRMLLHMNMESIADSVNRISERVLLAGSLLSMKPPEELAQEIKRSSRVARLLGPDIYPDNAYRCIDLAVQILDHSPLEEKRRKKRMEKNSARARMKTLQGFKYMLLTRSKDVTLMQQVLLSISYNILSAQSKLKYAAATRYTLDMTTSDRMALLLHLHRQENEENSTRAKNSDQLGLYQPESSSEMVVGAIPEPLQVPAESFCGSCPVLPRPAPGAQYQL
jgi:hypothetical protein